MSTLSSEPSGNCSETPPEGSSEAPPEHCRACGTALQGLYCHACGQGHRWPRLRTRALAEDFVEGVVNIDSRVFRTVWRLTIGPGRVVRDYLDGRRVIYINPFKYALATVTLAFFVIPWFGDRLLDDAQLSNVLPEWAKFINVLSLPVLAALLQLLFWRRRLFWIEHFVLVLYALGHTFLLQAILTPLGMLVGPPIMLVSSLVPIVWLGWTIHRVLGTGWLIGLGSGLLSFAATQAIAGGVVWLVAPELFQPPSP